MSVDNCITPWPPIETENHPPESPFPVNMPPPPLSSCWSSVSDCRLRSPFLELHRKRPGGYVLPFWLPFSGASAGLICAVFSSGLLSACCCVCEHHSFMGGWVSRGSGQVTLKYAKWPADYSEFRLLEESSGCRRRPCPYSLSL